jgi:phosphate starvation-inducible protein PhoH and related proteins
MADRGPTTSTLIVVPGGHSMVGLLGSSDELLRLIERSFSCDIHVRGNEITLSGEPAEVALAARLFEELITLLERREVLTPDAIQRSIAMLREQTDERPADVLSMNIISSRGRTIRPKTLNQKRYVEAIDDHTIIFGIGPAGTGKTYLAMAKAVQALQSKAVNRIILTRPAVEAGERLGFLPGTLNEKIDPYLRPLYDALHDMVDPDSIPRLMASGVIEVAPLGFMRGRAQPVDTPVLTPDGFRPIGELQVGDLVTGSDGLPTPVLGVYPQGRKEVFRVTIQDGASTLACGEHLWQVTTLDDRKYGTPGRVLQTAEMRDSLRRHHQRQYELPLVGPVEFPAREVPIDPYALGLLLGEDVLSDFEVANATTYDRVSREVDGGRGGLRLAKPGTGGLHDLGLAGTGLCARFVPAEYLYNRADIRLAVLQGLLDADGGSVTEQGRTCRVQYTTCSDRLLDDVVFIVRSLGGVVLRHDAHVVNIRLPYPFVPFRLQRKVDVYNATGGGRPMRMIESIEPAGEAECVCISVGAQDSLYVTNDFIVTHNTLNDSFVILDEAQNTSAEQMKMFLTRLGFGSKMVVTGDVTQVDLPAGTKSGLRMVQDILEGIEDVRFCRLTSKDVVRHRLVSDIVDAYAKYDAQTAADSAAEHGPQGPRRNTRSGR